SSSTPDAPRRHRRLSKPKSSGAAARIKSGRQTELRLGNLAIQRDWGWAPEYVDAMWRILRHKTPEDFVIATGQAHSLEGFLAATFAVLDLDWRNYVTVDK